MASATDTVSSGPESRLADFGWFALWGMLLATWMVRGFFIVPPGCVYESHELHSYIYRYVEFRDSLAAGHLSPQWFTNARSGLGGPVFSYYQPGVFYVATAFAALPPFQALGAALWLFSVAGFVGMAALVSRSFGRTSGLIAGALFLLSSYAGTNLYIRGDLSEYAAMMLVPVVMWALISWMESRRVWSLLVCIPAAALLVITHPCIALPGFGLFALLVIGYTIATRRWLCGATGMFALFLSGLLVAFYWLPVVREIDLVQSKNAMGGYFAYERHLIQPHMLLGAYDGEDVVPFKLGWLVTILFIVNGFVLNRQRESLSAEQRRLVVALITISLATMLMMTPGSMLIWKAFFPLQRIQFPWRLLSVLSMSVAGVCSLYLLKRSPQQRNIAAIVIGALAFWCSLSYTHIEKIVRYVPVEKAADIADTDFFRSDNADEWLPVGARREFDDGPPLEPTATAGVRVSDYRREICFLSCRIQAEQEGEVVLPHFDFIGWQATLDGNSVALNSDDDGLMEIAFQAGDSGQLEVRFEPTPARRTGLIVSAVAAGLSILFLFTTFMLLRRSPGYPAEHTRQSTPETPTASDPSAWKSIVAMSAE